MVCNAINLNHFLNNNNTTNFSGNVFWLIPFAEIKVVYAYFCRPPYHIRYTYILVSNDVEAELSDVHPEKLFQQNCLSMNQRCTTNLIIIPFRNFLDCAKMCRECCAFSGHFVSFCFILFCFVSLPFYLWMQQSHRFSFAFMGLRIDTEYDLNLSLVFCSMLLLLLLLFWTTENFFPILNIISMFSVCIQYSTVRRADSF